MADFRDIDPHIRCFALVGQFLHRWSAMESSLHQAIGNALSIEPVKVQILCANTDVTIDFGVPPAIAKAPSERKGPLCGGGIHQQNLAVRNPAR
jgi:hypothetical protein